MKFSHQPLDARFFSRNFRKLTSGVKQSWDEAHDREEPEPGLKNVIRGKWLIVIWGK